MTDGQLVARPLSDYDHNFPTKIIFIMRSFYILIYDLQSEDWINTYYMLKGFLKARRPPKVSNEMKCTNENMTWNSQHTNLNWWYVPKANVDHIISSQETAISILDYPPTTPWANKVNKQEYQVSKGNNDECHLCLCISHQSEMSSSSCLYGI